MRISDNHPLSASALYSSCLTNPTLRHPSGSQPCVRGGLISRLSCRPPVPLQIYGIFLDKHRLYGIRKDNSPLLRCATRCEALCTTSPPDDPSDPPCLPGVAR